MMANRRPRTDREKPPPRRRGKPPLEVTPTRDSAERADRKERVIHTRVPALLDKELKRLAGSLKLPVSNLVRAILEDALEAVDAVGMRAEGELHGMAERLSRQRDALRQRALAASGAAETATPSPAGEESTGAPPCPAERPALLDGVLGFERLVLAADVPCTVCGRLLRAGETAQRAVSERPGPRVLLGHDCRLVPGGTAKED